MGQIKQPVQIPTCFLEGERKLMLKIKPETLDLNFMKDVLHSVHTLIMSQTVTYNNTLISPISSVLKLFYKYGIHTLEYILPLQQERLKK